MPKLSMQKKLLIIFVILFTIPIVTAMRIISFYAVSFSRESTKTLNIRSIDYVGKSIDQFLGNAYDFSLYLNLNKDVMQFLCSPEKDIYKGNINVAAQSVLSVLPFSNSYIRSIAIFGKDNRYVNSGSVALTLSAEERSTASTLNGAPYWKFEKNSIYLIRMLKIPEKLNTTIGYVKIELNMAELNDFLLSDHDRSKYVIIDDKENILYSYPKTIYNEIPITMSFIKNNIGKSAYLEDAHCYINPYKLKMSPFFVYCISKDSYTQQLSSTLRTTLITSMIICFIFCFVLSFIFSNTIVYPLKKLGRLMKKIEQEDFSVRFEPKGHDEIATLANQFNRMSQRLNKLYNEVYLGQIQLKEMKLSVLQAQINPHFLYNTLDTIFWMSEFNHTTDVSNMISALSKLFQLALSGDENDMVLLKTELEHIECYLYIQKIRHQENLSYRITNKADSEHLSVLKLVLQPLVENAIIHGIDQIGQGEIDVLIEERNHTLVYEVSDTACTANPQQIARYLETGTHHKDHKKNQIGLININQRIKLRYSDSYGIDCHIKHNKTVFTVTLPIICGQQSLEEKQND